MGQPVRPLSVSVDIAAPPEAVWRVVADVRRTGEWSPECRKVVARGQVGGLGSRFVGVNRRGVVVWPTNAKVVRFEPNRVLAYRIAENGSTWTYALEPITGGTRLTETRTAEAGISRFASIFTGALLGGNDGHSDELEAGMTQSLATIKKVVEAGPAAPGDARPGHAGTW